MKASALATAIVLLALPQAAEASSQLAADELAVQRVPAEIEIAVDGKDWKKARSHFADQVRIDFTSLAGGEPATISADELIRGWAANLGPNKQSHHQRGWGLVTIDGDKATIYSQGYAWNRMEGNGDPLWEVWGNYTQELMRTSNGWKVTSFTFEKTHERGNMWVKNTPSPPTK